ncbi:MAG: hypothetical protein ACMZ63_06545 [Methylotenera sp.]
MDIEIVQKRKSLLPKWIKFFGWLFIIISVLIPINIILTPFLDLEMSYEIFGLIYVGSGFDLMALVIQLLIIFTGFSAYSLLFGKDWGVNICLINGYLGLVLCITSMILSGFTMFRLEPIIQIPYLIKLHKIKKDWDISDN